MNKLNNGQHNVDTYAIFGTMVLAVLFAFLSIAGNCWVGKGDINMGLWKSCIKGFCTNYRKELETGTFPLFNLEFFVKFILWKNIL